MTSVQRVIDQFGNKSRPDHIDEQIMIELRPMPNKSPSTMREIAPIVQRSYVTVQQRVAWLAKLGYVKRMEGTSKKSSRTTIPTETGMLWLNGDPATRREVELALLNLWLEKKRRDEQLSAQLITDDPIEEWPKSPPQSP